MKMARWRKFGVWQPWKVERKYCGIDIGKMKMARGRKFGVWQPRNSESEEKKRASMGSGKPWIGGGEKERTLAVPTLFE